MRVSIFGKSRENSKHLEGLLKKFGFTMDETNPEFIVSYGGDGTFLMAERAFPGIPKVLIRNSKICNKCHNHSTDHVLKMISEGKYKITELAKLKACLKNKELIATNDIVIRNDIPTHAIRFNLSVNNKQFENELIGDGLVIATQFGSTGYYYSVTRTSVQKGIGIAFNNLTKDIKPLILKETDRIKIELKRGNAYLVVDNNPEILKPEEGEIITIEKIDEVARIIEIS